ncbi:SGNH/GDSL hydrolase family protein [Phaeobacter sp. BS23]|uniref:SGNH/GDSL hydrolase family protein n=1 Tax=Phaeobacter sp. BS23 TaxID=2907239 RepID=UPI003866BE40
MSATAPPQGLVSAKQDDALCGQLTTKLAEGRHLTWRLEATTGHRSADALARVRALPPQTFDVAVLALGVNDVTRLTRRRRFHMEQSALIRLLRDRFGVTLVILSGVPPMADFPALPNPLAWVLGLGMRRGWTKFLPSWPRKIQMSYTCPSHCRPIPRWPHMTGTTLRPWLMRFGLTLWPRQSTPNCRGLPTRQARRIWRSRETE